MSVLRHKNKNRFKKKRTARKRVSVLRVLAQRGAAVGKLISVVALTAAMSCLFIFGHDYLTQCRYFRADRLLVEGVQKLRPDQVLRQADIRRGINILGLNLALARKRLLAHPWIAEASVGRELPSTVVVRVREHRPLAVLDLGKKFLVNTRGEIFKEMDDSDAADLPVVTGLAFSDITAGGQPRSLPFQAVMAVLGLGKASGSVLPNGNIRNIEVDREIGLTLYARDRINAIRIGYNGYREKYDKLKNVLFYLDTRQRFPRLDSIDLNDVNRIVVTPAGTASSDSDHKEV